MPSDEVYEQVRTIVAEHYGLPVSEILPSVRFVEDFASSLDVMEIFMVCEEVFNIVLSEDVLDGIGTVGQLTALIVSLPPSGEVVWPAASQP